MGVLESWISHKDFLGSRHTLCFVDVDGKFNHPVFLLLDFTVSY